MTLDHRDAAAARCRFDLIVRGPAHVLATRRPWASRTWDVQRDHVELLIGRIAPAHRRRRTAVFSLQPAHRSSPTWSTLDKYGVALEDITAQTIPHDFERNPRIHKCYLVKRA